MIFQNRENYMCRSTVEEAMSQPAESSRHGDFCPNCHINLAERYCSECGQVFCVPCSKQEFSEFHTCSRHGPEKVEECEGKWICQECEEPAQVATRRVFLCPNCGSETVTPIHNMRQDLVSRFRTTYYRLRTGHELLTGFAARLRILRWRIRELRLGGFLHDPDVEKEMLNLLKAELPSIQERILFRARNVVERHRASKIRFINAEQWTITDFPLLAGLIDGIQEDVADYQAYCRDLVEGLDAKLTSIEERLGQMAEWHKVFTNHIEYLCLNENEHPIAAIKPVSLHKSELSEGVNNGIFFLTTERMLFLGTKGLLSKETRVIHTVSLSSVQAAEMEGRIRRRLVIQSDEGELKIRGSSRVLEDIRTALGLATNFNQHSLVSTSGSMRILNLKVDMTSFRNELDRLVNYAISPEDIDDSNPVDSPRTHSYPESYYPHRFSLQNSQSDLEQDPVFQLEQQKFSLESTMELIKKQFEAGKLSDEKFFKQYRSLTQELYLIEARIRELATRSRYDDRHR